jgi:hypothetical protein
MCAVSMVDDFYYDKWSRNFIYKVTYVPSESEIEEFRKSRLLALAFDNFTNQPDCELEEKKQKLLKLAEEMGIEISFI